MRRFIFDMPADGIDPIMLETQCQGVNASAKVAIIGKGKEITPDTYEAVIRITDNGDEASAEATKNSYQVLVDAHNDYGKRFLRVINHIFYKINQYKDERIYARFDYEKDGETHSLNGDLISQFRMTAKLQDAIHYNKDKAPEDPEFSMLWLTKEGVITVTETDFLNMKYLLEARVTAEEFKAASIKSYILTNFTRIQDAREYDWKAAW